MRDRAQAKSTADNIGAQVGFTRLAEPLCTLEVQIAHSPKHPPGEHLHLAAAHHHAAPPKDLTGGRNFSLKMFGSEKNE
jgi:hypothetical protein